jgi:carboxyl-terminal processing protease
MDKNRKRLTKSYPTFDAFVAKFEVPQSVLDGILEEGKKQKIEPKDEAEKAHTEKNLRLMLKALVARDLWDMSEYFRIVYDQDEVVKKAVELLKEAAAKGE